MHSEIKNRAVIIGCDNIQKLSALLSSFNTTCFTNFSFNTISKAEDLEQAVNSYKPEIVILCFKYNQDALNILSLYDSCLFSTFCFTSVFESNGLNWTEGKCVFTYPYESALIENSFKDRILSTMILTKRILNSEPSTILGHDSSVNLSKNLSRYILELDQKKKVLDRVINRINDIYPHAKDETRRALLSLVNSIKSVKNNENYWNDFKQYFENINPGFLNLLHKTHPCLTAKDLKYCCYLRMNMSNHDITHLLGINQESVRTHKYRLKKKMVLSKEESLEHYLITFMQLESKTAS